MSYTIEYKPVTQKHWQTFYHDWWCDSKREAEEALAEAIDWYRSQEIPAEFRIKRL